MLKLLKFRSPEKRYYLNCGNTKLKRSCKINFSLSERHRWEVVGKTNHTTILLFWGVLYLSKV